MGNQQQAKFPLPEDILINILLLLPLQSLLACKCVSNQWRNLINNPEFVKLYRNKSTVFFLHKDTLYSLLHDNNKKIKPRPVPIGHLDRDSHERDHVLLLDSSNKRVCVKAANGHFLVYDLITGDSYKVIPPELRLRQRISCYGFGYDPYADDYKIVVVSKTVVFVYSFRNRGWKSSSKAAFPKAAYDWQPPCSAAYCFNGALHWVVNQSKERGKGKVVVLAMELHSCRLAEIALPGRDNNGNAYDRRPTLAELGGRLCLCDYGRFGGYGDGYTFDVWVMKEYGVKESWIKLLSIDDARYLRLRDNNTPFSFVWKTPPTLYSIDGRGKVAICVCHDSMLRVFEYELCNDKIRVLHKTSWVKERYLEPRLNSEMSLLQRFLEQRLNSEVSLLQRALFIVALTALLVVTRSSERPASKYGEPGVEVLEEVLVVLLIIWELIVLGYELLARLVRALVRLF